MNMSKHLVIFSLLSVLTICVLNASLRKESLQKVDKVAKVNKFDKGQKGSGDILNFAKNKQAQITPHKVETRQPEHRNLELVISNIPKTNEGNLMPQSNQYRTNQNIASSSTASSSSSKVSSTSYNSPTQNYSQVSSSNINENSIQGDKLKFENVQIIKSEFGPSRSPEYIKKEEKSDMKTATLINKDNDEKGPGGLTERPNYLSSVINSHATSVMTPNHLYSREEGTPTYDLDSISK